MVFYVLVITNRNTLEKIVHPYPLVDFIVIVLAHAHQKRTRGPARHIIIQRLITTDIITQAKKSEKSKRPFGQSQSDDYNKILRLYPSIDSTLAKGYDKEIQEAIKMASLAIQRHPNSKWVDDCYILVGKARLYSLDWGNAIQTFKFVNTKSKDPERQT